MGHYVVTLFSNSRPVSLLRSHKRVGSNGTREQGRSGEWPSFVSLKDSNNIVACYLEWIRRS